MATAGVGKGISSGTWDAPSWDLIRTAKLAARMYAPLGTSMTLGDYVRLTKAFLDCFKVVRKHGYVLYILSGAAVCNFFFINQK